MNKENLMKIQVVIDEAVKTKAVAGCNCLVYKNGQEMGYWQSGSADIENNKSFERNTICRLYSMSKPVTAVAVMILVERGLLDLNQWAADIIPEFNNLMVCKGNEIVRSSRPLLIKDLMNMTSGYSYGGDSNESERQISAFLYGKVDENVSNENDITTIDVAKKLASIPVAFEPGTDYQYGLSADIMGAIVEIVSGMKYGEFLKKNIFEPLGMKDTDFYVPAEKQSRLSCVYERKGEELNKFTSNRLGIQNSMKLKPAFESGGAGLCSTVDDYMKFAAMLANKGTLNGVQILKPKTVEYLSSSKLNDRLQQCFDYKMEHLAGYTYRNLNRVCIDKGLCGIITENGEFGWDGWLGPYMCVDIKNNIALVYMQQRTDTGTTPTSRKIHNIVYTSLVD